ncbi:hypothetical protein [Rhizomicrobium electricum]|uniref:Rap1a immunity protein domain-containing protein n=1 Tax=Rhizomicrobium electricum TaxID=480070 RepID=A0ABP3QBV8_9PROT|nr:hypothetical protein [Rhizomicrobium electricum]NIJ50438.1 hypothetical protein [Rhizomicrobium electricum]
MTKYILAALALAAALSVPAAATDMSSLSAFVSSCTSDSKGCHSAATSAIHSARNAKYGCIPEKISADDAGDRLLDWLRYTAAKDPKYVKESLADLMWTGIDEVWPCKK